MFQNPVQRRFPVASVLLAALLSFGCSDEQPLGVAHEVRPTFTPTAGAVHRSAGDGFVIVWREGQASYGSPEAAGREVVVECAESGSTVSTPSHLYGTNFELSTYPEFRAMYLDAAEQVGHLRDLASEPYYVSGAPTQKITFTGMYTRIIVPVYAYREELQGETWVVVDNMSSVMIYRTFQWNVSAESLGRSRCHEQGGGS